MASMATSEPPPPPSKSPTGSNSTVNHVVLGDLLFRTWYPSIYPEDLVAKDTDRLYVCRWCFRYSSDVAAFVRHTRVCDNKTAPPGTKVYEHGGYSVWEVDGEEHKLFAQNLSLFARLFLDHKTIFFDVASFLFYLLTFTDPNDPQNNKSYQVLGFFSKEKMPWDANNLACILIFPPYQHRQLGKLLIGVSYKLSGWEWDAGLIGSPERPLSGLGWKSYARFWEERVARYLLLGPYGQHSEAQQRNHDTATASPKTSKKKPHSESMTVQDIGLATGMLTEDVITALRGMGIVETEKPPIKRKSRRQHSTGDDAAVDQDNRTVVVHRSRVLEWAKNRRVALQDPVREEGFLGKWARSTTHESHDASV